MRKNFDSIIEIDGPEVVESFWQIVAEGSDGGQHLANDGFTYFFERALETLSYQSKIRPGLHFSIAPMAARFRLLPQMYSGEARYREAAKARARVGGEANVALSECELNEKECLLLFGLERGKSGPGAVYWSFQMAAQFASQSARLYGGHWRGYEYSVKAQLYYPASLNLVEPEWNWAKSEGEAVELENAIRAERGD